MTKPLSPGSYCLARTVRMLPQENGGLALFMGTRPQQVRPEGPLTYLPTANLLVRRALWQRLDGFAPLTFGEDVDFCRRLLATGSPIIYLPQGIVYHDYRTTLPAFLSIRASYASAEAALLQRHPKERRMLLLPLEQATFDRSYTLSGHCSPSGCDPRRQAALIRAEPA